MGLFKSDTVQISHDISLVYSPTAGSQIIELVNNNPNQIRNKFGLGNVAGVANGLLDELRCYASISSLAEVSLPDIAPEDTESEKIVKVQSFEWSSARFELAIFKKAKGQADWAEFGVAALKNSSGFRYRIHRILDLTTDNIGARIGEWGRIGVAIRSVGYGFPQNLDRITFTGHWVQEFTWVQEHPTYVVVNNYGGGSSPTPTPTPTPPPIPTLTLSLASGSTSAVANNDEKITLNIEDIPTGTQLTGTWFKNGVDTGVAETVTTVEGPILLSTLKLREKLPGSYSLRLFYNDNGYLSNSVAVTVNPEVSISLPSGTTTALTGSSTPILVTGKYFNRSGSVPISYSWLRSSDNVAVFTSSGNNSINIVNGSFTINLVAAQLQNGTTGNYRFRLYLDNTSTIPFVTNEIAVQVTNPPAVVISPSSANVFNGVTYTFTITLSHFTNGEVLNTVWQREGVDLTSTATTRTFNPSSGTSVSYTVQSTSIYNGNTGNYRLKVTTPSGLVMFSNTCLFHVTNTSGGEG